MAQDSINQDAAAVAALDKISKHNFNHAACIKYAVACGVRPSKLQDMFTRAARYYDLRDLSHEYYRPPSKRPLKTSVGYELLRHAREQSVPMNDIQHVFKQSFMDRVLSYASFADRPFFEDIVGKAPSNKRILCDECTPPELVQLVQKNFGEALNIYSIGCEGVKDPDLVERAMKEHDVDVIISMDRACKGANDLSYVVQNAFNRRDQGEDIRPPGLVLLRSAKPGLIQLKAATTLVQDYIDADPYNTILDVTGRFPKECKIYI